MTESTSPEAHLRAGLNVPGSDGMVGAVLTEEARVG